MPDRADILWFKRNFQARIEPALAGTPLTADMLVAIACQETGHIWPLLRRTDLPTAKVLALCVGDTLDADKGRRAFPRDKADLLSQPGGERMFAVARQALLDMAQYVPGYAQAAARAHKFCHGFGVFQRDLQFFRSDPDYFLERRYEDFDTSLAPCVEELKRSLRKLGLAGRATLADAELAAVGIAYNTGGHRPARGLKQGHFDGSQYYGEALFDYLRLAHTVALPGDTAPLSAPAPGTAIVPPPTPLTAAGARYRVKTREGMLRLRSAPGIGVPPTASVIAHLPDGHAVQAVGSKVVQGFREIETSLQGALLRGYAASACLVRERSPQTHTAIVAVAAHPDSGVVAARMPRARGRLTRRSDPAGPHALDEAGQPGRRGTSAAGLRAELDAIVDWLGVDDPGHARYRPRAGLSFCNVYAHDYCHLAGVYLPRVWWSVPALLALAAGETVQPLIGDTVHEMRANDLFRWLNEHGPRFGWRRTGSVDKLQQAANQGAVALLAARRREDGRSGHIAAVVPETGEWRARRDAAGAVTAPLQSQAGARNFRRGHGRPRWWSGPAFADSAYWIHA